MPLGTDEIWTPRSAAAWRSVIQASLDDALGTAQDYGGTILGALVWSIGHVAWLVDQRVGDALATQLLATAPEAVVYQVAADRGIIPRPGVPTRVLVSVSGSLSLLPIGSVLRMSPINQALLRDPTTGGLTDVSETVRFTVVDSPLSDPSLNLYVIEASIDGLIIFSGGNEAAFVPTGFVPGVSLVIYDGDAGGEFFGGAAPESVAELRRRVASARSAVSGTAEGLRAALLAIPGVLAAGIGTPDPGVIAPRLALLPRPGIDVEIAQAIYDSKAASDQTTGTTTANAVDAEGQPVPISFAIGDAVIEPCVVTATTDGTVTDADTTAAIGAAILDYMSTVGPGETVRYSRVYAAAASVAGVIGVTLTLDGGAADLSPPTGADAIVLTVAVTIA